MKRIGIWVLVLMAALVAVPGYSIWSTVNSCTAKARTILDEADPMDRQPPPQVAATIEKTIPAERMPDLLATVLLDRYACRGSAGWNGTDWLIDHPAVSWWLRQKFDHRTLLGLYASTADMGKGDVGLSRGARRLYHKDISKLDERAVECLLRKVMGKPDFEPSTPGFVPPFAAYPNYGRTLGCATDGFPVRPIYD